MTQEPFESTSASPRSDVAAASVEFDADLRDLVSRGLVQHDTEENRFDLHPIVRQYAYDRLAGPARAAAHTKLRDYFAAVPPPDDVTRMEELAPVIELYHHTVRAGQLDEAFTLFRDRLCPNPLYFQFGAYQLIIDLLRPLFPNGEDCPPRLKNESDQAWALNALASSYSLCGQSRHAVQLFEQQIAIREAQGEKGKGGLAVALGNVANDQVKIGALRAAEANLRRSLKLSQEMENYSDEAYGHTELGWLLAYRGADAESETVLARAMNVFDKQNDVQAQGIVWAYRAHNELLRRRADSESAIREPKFAIESARRALNLVDERAHTTSPIERDYVRAHWLLGAAHHVAGQVDEAQRHLHEALERCRRINMVDHEASILIDLARLRADTDVADEAQRLADKARVIAERSEYVLQGADAHLELAKLALARGDQATAKEHAEEAHRLATCDGPPDYTYKAAYDEAAALLEELAL